MRLFSLALAVLLVGCGSPPPPPKQTPVDPTSERWYGQSVTELTDINREAKTAREQGKPDVAAALITKGQPLADRLLSAPRPTLAAMEAASDLDQLYGQMLLSNHHYGWARLVFQKDAARWQYWRPQTPDTASRLKRAKAEIAECDKGIEQ